MIKAGKGERENREEEERQREIERRGGGREKIEEKSLRTEKVEQQGDHGPATAMCGSRAGKDAMLWASIPTLRP